MRKIVVRSILVLLVLLLGLFWLLFFSARPPLTIDAATLAGDGSTINYCQQPVLDGRGKLAIDIAKGNTPGCGYAHFPLPILAACTEPLVEAADDIRGLWIGVEGGNVRADARGRYTEMLRDDPNNTDALEHIGFFYVGARKPTKALEA